MAVDLTRKVYIVFDTAAGKDQLVLDAAITYSASAEVTLTRHPIEAGAPISDHAQEQPERFSLAGIVSNTPILQDERDDAGAQVPFEPGRANTALEMLRAIKSAKAAVSVTTPILVLENYVMTSLEIPVDAKTGDALRFTSKFEQVSIVRTERVLLTSVPRTPTGLKNKNKQVPKPASAAAVKKSIIKNAVDTVSEYLSH